MHVKVIVRTLPVVLLVLVLSSACQGFYLGNEQDEGEVVQRTKRQVPPCDCDYHHGGCTISLAPPTGFKCQCAYKGFWTCSGNTVGCATDEDCPGGCYSRACCQRGNGDCGGYRT